MTSPLFAAIHEAASLFPPSTLQQLANLLSEADQPYSDSLANRLLCSLTNQQFRRVLTTVLHAWKQEPTTWKSMAIAAALLSSAYANREMQHKLSAELVWTGPEPSYIPIRRTDQVLLQLIQESQQELVLISFAIYKVPVIVQALQQALDRGIHLLIIAETPTASDGKITFGLEATFGSNILSQAQVLVWPRDKRPTSTNGKYGSLHVKGAVSDQRQLFITSANLTEYALSINMELGVLIQSKVLSKQLIDQIKKLKNEKLLVPSSF